jgi:hypothetical protein
MTSLPTPPSQMSSDAVTWIARAGAVAAGVAVGVGVHLWHEQRGDVSRRPQRRRNPAASAASPSSSAVEAAAAAAAAAKEAAAAAMTAADAATAAAAAVARAVDVPVPPIAAAAISPPAASPQTSAAATALAAESVRRATELSVSGGASDGDDGRPIYLDYNATTPIAPEVAQAMTPFLTAHYGNPSSAHAYGSVAKAAVDRARAQVAALIGAVSSGEEIVLTSCATEATNYALKGLAQWPGDHFITCATEHPATIEVAKYLQEKAMAVTFVGVDNAGLVDGAAVVAAVTERTVCVSLMLANNETGTIAPIGEIFAAVQAKHAALLSAAAAASSPAPVAGRVARPVVCHVDASQAIGKIPVDVQALHCHLMTVAAHKFYGPKGEETMRRPFSHSVMHLTGLCSSSTRVSPCGRHRLSVRS